MAKVKASKGKGSEGRRSDKRKKRFAPAAGGGGGGARANVLGADGAAGAGAKRPRAAEGTASPAAKKYKQGTFARPAAGKAGGAGGGMRSGVSTARGAPAASLSRKELAAAVEARKTVRKPNATLIQELTTAWEKLRRLNTTKEERERLTAEVWRLSAGHVRTLASSHKASRALQAVLKYGTAAQRAALVAEAAPELPMLAKDAYGTHLVRRLADTADKAELLILAKALKGSACAMARHPFGAPCLDALYCRLPAKQRAAVLAEFYGPQFALAHAAARHAADDGTAPPPPRLADALESMPAAARAGAVARLGSRLFPILEKGLVSFAYLHRVLAEYLAAAGPAGVAEAAASVAGPALLRMIHTADGARAAAALLGGAAARERKAALKALKGRVADVARDAHGHVALLAALDCVDDTALLRTALLAELAPGLAGHACHPHARRLLLHLLAPRSSRYTPPDVLAALPVQQAAPPAGGADPAPRGDAAEEEEEESDSDSEGVGEGRPGVLALSKKPPAQRRAELLAALAPPLAAACAAAAPQLLRHPLGCDVLFEAARGGTGGAFAAAAGADAMAKLHAAIAAAAASEEPMSALLPGGEAADGNGDGDGDAVAVAEIARDSFHATRTLRRLVLADADAEAEAAQAAGPAARGAQSFASVLWKGTICGKAPAWAAGHGAKVLAACCVCADAAVAAAACAEAAPLLAPEKPAEWAKRHIRAVLGAAEPAPSKATKAAAAPKAAPKASTEADKGKVVKKQLRK